MHDFKEGAPKQDCSKFRTWFRASCLRCYLYYRKQLVRKNLGKLGKLYQTPKGTLQVYTIVGFKMVPAYQG